MYRTHTCGELRITNAGQTVTLAGWVQRTRKLGGMTFVDLRDRYGITQLVVDASASADLIETAGSLGREFVIQATGEVIERQSKNPKMPTGDIEIRLSSINILNKAQTPPFTIEDVSDGGEELRAKYRYLDLRRNPLKKALELRHRLAHEVRNYLDSKGFEVDDDKLQAEKTTYFLRMIVSVVMVVGGVISVLSFYILMLSIYLLVQKNTSKLENLMLIGYSPFRVAMPYVSLTLCLNALVLVVALAVVASVRGGYMDVVITLFPQMDAGTLFPSVVLGLALFVLVSLANLFAIYRKMMRIWYRKDE